MTAQSEAPSDRFGIVQAFDRSAHVESRRDLYTTDLSRLYGHTDVRRGEAATPSRILRQLSERDVVHIAAPLIADRDDPARWRLVVADEPGRRYSGSVSSADLTQARVRTRLVTFDPEFSERVSSSGGVQSVARALMAAGVPDVVGPVVSLPSATYDDIWLEFHRRYLAGWSAVDSLRGVQLGALADANRRLGSWATLTVFSRTK
jgi:hypothetical protein